VKLSKLILLTATAALTNSVKLDWESSPVTTEYMTQMLELANRKDTARSKFKALNVIPTDKTYIG
jgi:hypothetical protein